MTPEQQHEATEILRMIAATGDYETYAALKRAIERADAASKTDRTDPNFSKENQ